MKVGFIGAGRMGRPVVTRLVEAGHEVQVLGRTAEKRRELEQLAATAMSETAAAGAHADAVVRFVFSDEQVRQACLDSAPLPTMPAGSALMVHTTSSPKTIEAVAARAACYGVDAVDAAVSGARTTSRPPNSRLRPVLDCYGVIRVIDTVTDKAGNV